MLIEKRKAICCVPTGPGQVCGHVFSGPALSIPILGQPAGAEISERIQKLHRHVGEKHREFAGVLTTFAVLLLFDTDDETLAAIRETGRQKLFQMSRNRPLPDEVIADGVKQLGLVSSDDTKAVIEFCLALRDGLLEIGRYAPQEPMVQPNAFKA